MFAYNITLEVYLPKNLTAYYEPMTVLCVGKDKRFIRCGSYL